jgi:UDP-N-acetyl-D-mannosaminouronate:lipid I N-acetyl-D-mannosaminouronosyltransferase
MKEHMAPFGTADIAGLTVTGFESLVACARHVLASALNKKGGAAFAINAEKVVSYIDDRNLRCMLEEASLRYPDGAGVVVAMRRRGTPTARIPGVDLWLAILRQVAPAEVTVALIGSKKDVLRQVCERLIAEFPHVRILLAVDGFEGVDDVSGLQANLAGLMPQFVFVAMGTPRQEELIASLRRCYPDGYYLGLGGSFDVYCGLKRRAPVWMQRLGMEWLFRFLMEPSRAGRERKRLRFLKMLILGHV